MIKTQISSIVDVSAFDSDQELRNTLNQLPPEKIHLLAENINITIQIRIAFNLIIENLDFFMAPSFDQKLFKKFLKYLIRADSILYDSFKTKNVDFVRLLEESNQLDGFRTVILLPYRNLETEYTKKEALSAFFMHNTNIGIFIYSNRKCLNDVAKHFTTFLRLLRKAPFLLNRILCDRRHSLFAPPIPPVEKLPQKPTTCLQRRRSI